MEDLHVAILRERDQLRYETRFYKTEKFWYFLSTNKWNKSRWVC